MLKEKQIKGIASLVKFSKMYKQKSKGGLANVKYLRKGQTYVYVFYHPDNPEDWKGGYCTCSSFDESRYLDAFSEQEKIERLQLCGILQQDILELGCLWLHSKKLGVWGRLMAYIYIFITLLKTDKKVILAGSFLKQLHGMQHCFFPHLLFDGVIVAAGKEAYAKLYFAYKSELIRNFFIALFYDLKNTLIKKRFLPIIIFENRVKVPLNKFT